jgi:hypothetical protein
MSPAEIAQSKSQAAMHLLESLPVALELLLEHWALSPIATPNSRR